MVCRLCGTEATLVNSHIVPKSFYEIDPGEPESTKLISNSPGTFAKRVRIGIYDQIVCRSCEQIFSVWDDYANKLLLQERHTFEPVTHNGEPAANFCRDFDYQKLKLFFMSLLWRISVSEHEMYSRVNLGPFENQLRGMILVKEPGTVQQFATILAQFGHPAGMLDPHPARMGDRKCIQVYLSSYIAYIKVDSRRFTGFWQDFIMTPDQPLHIISRDFSKSKERRLMREMASRYPNLFRPKS